MLVTNTNGQMWGGGGGGGGYYVENQAKPVNLGVLPRRFAKTGGKPHYFKVRGAWAEATQVHDEITVDFDWGRRNSA